MAGSLFPPPPPNQGHMALGGARHCKDLNPKCQPASVPSMSGYKPFLMATALSTERRNSQILCSLASQVQRGSPICGSVVPAGLAPAGQVLEKSHLLFYRV